MSILQGDILVEAKLTISSNDASIGAICTEMLHIGAEFAQLVVQGNYHQDAPKPL